MRGGGATTRFMTLLTTPVMPLRPSLLQLRRHITTTTTALNLISLPLSKPRHHHRKTANLLITSSFHSQPNNASNTSYDTTLNSQPRQHPWPEWTQFLNLLSTSNDGQGSYALQGTSIPPEDAFVVYEELPDDFVRCSAKCLAFARVRPELLGFLSRRDIEAVVSNGTPFLFKSAIDSARRMRAFLETDGNNVSETEKASTVDLMKYILSYASNPHPTVSSERKGLYSREVVDSSVRNLLHELSIISSKSSPTGHSMSTSDSQFSGRYGQTLKPFGPNIEMKRGDWICPKCTFMNFARNTKCLECEEIRPKRLLTGAEWECPQCNFNNYGRNSACLRCDCKKPGAPLFSTANSRSGSGYSGESRLAEKERWFNNISRLNNASDMNGGAISADQKRISAYSQHPNNISGQQSPNDNFQSPNEANINNSDSEKEVRASANWFDKIKELHDVKDSSNSISDDDFPESMPTRKVENSTTRDGSFTSSKFNRQVNTGQANNSNFVPFVPFPPGYFARKETEEQGNSPLESSTKTSSNKSVSKNENLENSRNEMTSPSTAPSNKDKTLGSFNSRFSSNIVTRVNSTTGVNNQPASSTSSHNINNNTSAINNTNVQPSWSGPSLEGSAVKEPDPLDMSEEAKAERWFKRVAQIKDISELSQIPDEDFPSIMPMRKGVNRFVVSKRKTPLERRLTSQQYRRNLPIVSNNPIKKDTDNNNNS